MKMSMELLNVICAVIDYKKFICSNNRILKKDDFDWLAETEKYFKTLPLPAGLIHNRITFEKILDYTRNTKMKEYLQFLEGLEEEKLCEYNF